MAKWYNPSDMDSYGKTLNFIIGGRGIGKTYSMKRRCIKRFLRSGKQFIYLRRYQSELKKIHQFFNDIALEFPKLKLMVKGGKDGARFYINDKLAGWLYHFLAMVKRNQHHTLMLTRLYLMSFY